MVCSSPLPLKIPQRHVADVNDTHVIRKQPKMTAINSAIEVDITGQVRTTIRTCVYRGARTITIRERLFIPSLNATCDRQLVTPLL